MYEAPDRYKRMIAARLPDGESLGLASEQDDTASTPLKDVQLISRAQLAPFFAAANIVASVMMIAAMWDEAGAVLLLPWLATVAGVNLLAMHVARVVARSRVRHRLTRGEAVAIAHPRTALGIDLMPSVHAPPHRNGVVLDLHCNLFLPGGPQPKTRMRLIQQVRAKRQLMNERTHDGLVW